MRRLTESEIEEEGLRFDDWEAGLFSWNWDENNKPVRFFFSPVCIEEWKPKDDQWWARLERIISSPHFKDNNRIMHDLSFNETE